MANYHKERKEWAKVSEGCEKALTYSLKEEGEEEIWKGMMEGRLLLLIADAAEAQGDMSRAQEYDEKAKKVLVGKESTYFPELMICYRREALKVLAAGRPHEAVNILERVPGYYMGSFEQAGIEFIHLPRLRNQMAALRVLVHTLMHTGDIKNVGKAILAGYHDGVLEETRWELREQRRAAASLSGATMPKGKAAKRKQQKRKAQQQKKAAEMAEAAAAAAVARGEEVTQGLDGIGTGSRQEEHREEREQEQENQEGNGDEQAVLVATAALAAMAVGGTKGQAQEEEEEEECSVCLNAIEGNDAGPPLLCGHRYHAFCLHFWVERCRSKCIEPTCPYCRAPLQEMGST